MEDHLAVRRVRLQERPWQLVECQRGPACQEADAYANDTRGSEGDRQREGDSDRP